MTIELIREARKQARQATRYAVASPRSKFALWNPRTGMRLHFD
jgi:hypothetical protein